MPSLDRAAFYDPISWSDGQIYPLYRQQSSRTAGGFAQIRDLGDPLWAFEGTTVVLSLDEAYELETLLLRLGGSLDRVGLSDPRREFAALRAPPIPAMGDRRMITGISANNLELPVVDISTAPYSLSLGDYFTIFHDSNVFLHRITEILTPAGTYRIFPHLPHGIQFPRETFLFSPWTWFQIDPDSVNTTPFQLDNDTKNAQISFRAIQAFI